MMCKNQMSILGMFLTKYPFLKMGNYGLFQIFDLSIPSEQALSKLSENRTVIIITHTPLCCSKTRTTAG